MIVETDVSVPMRDDVTLVADVYRPEGNSRVPAILIRTTYDKSEIAKADAHIIDVKLFVSNGFAVVAQDVRGRYRSGGRYYHGTAETQDGYDTLEWIASQPWSDGRVGMTGVSYLAAVQCAAAISGTGRLRSIFHVKAPFDYYQYGFRQHGAFLMYSVPIAFLFAASGREALGDSLVRRSLTEAWKQATEWIRSVPIKTGLSPLAAAPDYERWLVDMFTRADYDEFWKSVPLWQPGEFIDEYADIPGFYVGGWYDLYREDMFFAALRAKKTARIKLLLGPWSHHGTGREVGDVDFGPDAAMDNAAYQGLQLRWFKETLADPPANVGDELPVRIFVMGGGDGRKTATGRMSHGGRWRSEPHWPLARARETPFYLHSGGSLSPDRPAQANAARSFLYDPKSPVPTIGGTSYFISGRGPDGAWELFAPFGPQDQRERPGAFGCSGRLPLSARADVLVFQTPPLAQDIEVTGPLVAHVWVSSSAVDTDFTVKLIDVHPPNEDYVDGYAMNLSDGIIRARYRAGFERAVLMTPGEVYRLRIEMYPTSNLFKQGHRIRVDISSSNYPTYDVNPNTGDSPMAGGKCIVAENCVRCEASNPSHIVLPIVPLSSIRDAT